jgi:hypothetical protein
MKYRNISGVELVIVQAELGGVRSHKVAADAEFVTSPIHAKVLLETKSIERVDAKLTGKAQKENTETAE